MADNTSGPRRSGAGGRCRYSLGVISPEPAPLRPWSRWVLALIAGVVSALGFQPFNLWPLLLVGVGTLTVLVVGLRPRTGFGLGYLYGLAFLTVTVGWVYVIAVPVAVALVVCEALWFGLLSRLLSAVAGLRLWPLWAAACWVSVEFCYSRIPFGGFGWFRLGFAMADSPLAGLYPLTSVAGVSFVTALVGQVLAWALITGNDARHRVVRLGAGIAAFTVLAGSGLLVRSSAPAPAETVRTVTVGMVQGNVDGVAGVEAMGRARSVTRNHLAETVTLMARVRAGEYPMPELVVWPENSTDIDPILDAETEAVVQTAVDLAQVPILVGAVTEGPGEQERQTTALWWDPRTGPGPRYHKRNLVPFGEWIPYRAQLLPLIPMLNRVGRQSIPGTGPGVLQVQANGQPLRVGVMICFELAYDQTFRDAIVGDETTGGGAQLITVQSNNATYAGTGQIPQQWAITRVRAMESQREILVATTNARSGDIHPDGQVGYHTEQRTADSYTVSMPVREQLTWAVRYGAEIEGLLVVAGVAGLVLRVGTAWKNRTQRFRER